MYACSECRSSFEVPAVIREDYGEEFNICPICESDQIGEAQECRCCCKYIEKWKLTERICDDCMAMWRDDLRATLRGRYSEEELFFISVAMDGKSINYPDPHEHDDYHDVGAVA